MAKLTKNQKKMLANIKSDPSTSLYKILIVRTINILCDECAKKFLRVLDETITQATEY